MSLKSQLKIILRERLVSREKSIMRLPDALFPECVILLRHLRAKWGCLPDASQMASSACWAFRGKKVRKTSVLVYILVQ